MAGIGSRGGDCGRGEELQAGGGAREGGRGSSNVAGGGVRGRDHEHLQNGPVSGLRLGLLSGASFANKQIESPQVFFLFLFF